MDKSNFVENLRLAREFRKYTLAEVASLTRISEAYVVALEEGRWSDIPPAYVRGYVALVARTVGMNEDKVMREFDLWAGTWGSGSAPAELHSARPLLPAPSRVGVTRAKIRAGWYAEVTSRRWIAYGIMLLLTGLLLTGLVRVRHDMIVPSIQAALMQAIDESGSQTHAPYTVIKLNDADSMNSEDIEIQDYAVYCIGNCAGALRISENMSKISVLNYDAYDTIRIDGMSPFLATIFPLGSARVSSANFESLVSSYTLGDTAFYYLHVKKMRDVSGNDY